MYSDPDIHKPMALLAFKSDSKCPRYKVRAKFLYDMSVQQMVYEKVYKDYLLLIKI